MPFKHHILVLFCALGPWAANAQVHEFTGSTNAGLSIDQANASDPIAAYIAIGYANRFRFATQFVVELAAVLAGVDGKRKDNAVLALGLNHNLGHFPEALYFGLRGTFLENAQRFGFRALVGKRVPLAPNVSLNPEVIFAKPLTGDYKPWSFEIKIINFAILF